MLGLLKPAKKEEAQTLNLPFWSPEGIQKAGSHRPEFQSQPYLHPPVPPFSKCPCRHKGLSDRKLAGHIDFQLCGYHRTGSVIAAQDRLERRTPIRTLHLVPLSWVRNVTPLFLLSLLRTTFRQPRGKTPTTKFRRHEEKAWG